MYRKPSTHLLLTSFDSKLYDPHSKMQSLEFSQRNLPVDCSMSSMWVRYIGKNHVLQISILGEYNRQISKVENTTRTYITDVFGTDFTADITFYSTDAGLYATTFSNYQQFLRWLDRCEQYVWHFSNTKQKQLQWWHLFSCTK